MRTLSLPSWERGLKLVVVQSPERYITVAPFVGAWIETQVFTQQFKRPHVAPFVGAWIETQVCAVMRQDVRVAPFVGAWIETPVGPCAPVAPVCRSLRGSVD